MTGDEEVTVTVTLKRSDFEQLTDFTIRWDSTSVDSMMDGRFTLHEGTLTDDEITDTELFAYSISKGFPAVILSREFLITYGAKYALLYDHYDASWLLLSDMDVTDYLGWKKD